MLSKCTNADIPCIVDYIGEGKYQCFYLYVDMLEYGTNGDGFGLWISGTGKEIEGVAYRYHSTLHLYSHNIFPSMDALSLIKELRPKCITGPQACIEPLLGKTTDSYKLELSNIISRDRPSEIKRNLPIELAGEDDIPEIASIMMDDPVYQHVYTYERLCRELKERIQNGFGRTFVIRDKHKEILASNATYAESSEIVVSGGLVTRKRVRGTGLGAMLTEAVFNMIYSEKKRFLAFVSVENKEAEIMNRKLGFDFIGVYARLLRE